MAEYSKAYQAGVWNDAGTGRGCWGRTWSADQREKAVADYHQFRHDYPGQNVLLSVRQPDGRWVAEPVEEEPPSPQGSDR